MSSVANSRAVNVGNDGKFMEASTPPASHVVHPLVDVVAARPNLLEALGLEAVLLLGTAGHRVEGRVLDDRFAEDPDVRAVIPPR